MCSSRPARGDHRRRMSAALRIVPSPEHGASAEDERAHREEEKREAEKQRSREAERHREKGEAVSTGQ